VKKNIISLLLLITFTSCVVQLIRGNDFENLSDSNRKRIKKLDTFDNLNTEFIYEVTGKQLIEELKMKKKAIVYLFANGCTSDNCIPLSNIVRYADTNDYELYLVMISYYKLKETLLQQFESQLFSVNVDYYGEEKSRKYMEAFKNELAYKEFTKGEYLGGYIFFQQGEIVDVKMNLQ